MSTTVDPVDAIEKLPTGIPGFDHISQGGLPLGRTALVAGTSGSAKTVFACQFLAAGILQYDEACVFITFEETPKEIRKNMLGFGWDIEKWEAEKRWTFVDASPEIGDEQIVMADYDFGGLLARIEFAIEKTGARRVAFDSIGAIFAQFADTAIVRRELLRIVSVLRELKTTAVLTAERTAEYGPVARYDVEEFVSDNVIILRNVLEGEKRRRTLEILKFRGTVHNKGEFPFTVMPGSGLEAIPLSAIELEQGSTNTRITSGNEDLDSICGGGFFRDSVILVSGATGTGKTLMVSEFAGACDKGEKCLIFAFEESREQLTRNADGWGLDFPEFERRGRLRLSCFYPESATLEDHLIRIRREIEAFQPDRVAIDSLSALERVSSVKAYREFVISITAHVKQQNIAMLVTATTPSLLGGSSVTEAHISSITDSIILLRYVELLGEMRRGLTVIKMRGSRHDKDIREYTIDSTGMSLGEPFRNVTGIISGMPQGISVEEQGRLNQLFE
ncbi:circadian clock protein KaiC [Denitrobaculum tricleocarpae]|uniref:non-specific serine/threonine protein kinase n=1 Tax=Denitrobaculum tricleocarpae TaxID=2591009 RepID=A0A545SYM8_9PROT|nr:circadian clock protein KaiC [Denitrobaculum tricleocarpae]TQV70073.1 circadian clock protein KaiC [Denitrobaculum tricleocarpae]